MTNAADKRGKITAENLREAAALKAIWEREKPRLTALGWGSQEAFGDRFKIGNQAAVGFFLNGKTALSAKAAAAFARGLECQVSDFSPRLAEILAGAVTPAGWPFPDIPPERFHALSATAKIEIQGVVRERIESFERDQAASGKRRTLVA